MELSIILMGIGIICIIISFFLKDSTVKIEKDLEELSLSIYQETNSLKKRLKMVEEELLLEPNFKVKTQSMPEIKSISSFKPNEQKKQKPETKIINEILVNQVINLKKQGHSIDDISKMSTLSKEQIHSILRGGK